MENDPREAKMRHLEMIQAVVSRMAGKLFFLKGWSITLIAGTLALAAKDSNAIFIVLPYFPIFMFWGLDGYFLSQERLFRALYNEVRNKPDTEIDFSMDTSPYTVTSRNTWKGSVFSTTLCAFYIPLLLVVLAFTFVILPK